MSILIRPASQADSPSVAEVIKAVYDEYNFSWDPDDYHADLYDLDAYYFDLGHEFYVAEVDGAVVATAALEKYASLPGQIGTVGEVGGKLRVLGTDCSLERLYVRPNSRRLGLGGRLMSQVLESARADGRRAMEVWSDKRFEDAHRLYSRFGAEVLGDRVCDDPDESPEWGLLIRL